MIFYSAFIYGYNVDSSNNKIYFEEPGDVVTRETEISRGSYTISTLATAIENSLNEAGDETYTVTVDKQLRTFTITSTLTFDLLPSFNSDSVFPTIGIPGDVLGVATTTGATTGNEYRPQAPLDNYTPFGDNVIPLNPQRTTAISGLSRSTTIGRVNRMSCDFNYINEEKRSVSHWIKPDPNAFTNLKNFLDFVNLSNNVEFIPDISNYNNSNVCVLVSTGRDRTGLGYRIRTIYNFAYFTFKSVTGLEFQEL